MIRQLLGFLCWRHDLRHQSTPTALLATPACSARRGHTKPGVLCLVFLLLFGLGVERAWGAIRSCSVATTAMVFAEYNTVTRAQVDTVARIDVTCTGEGLNLVRLGLGPGLHGTCAARKLGSSTNRINYQLYQDAARSVDWCDSKATSLSMTFDFRGTASDTQTQPVSVYGRVPAGQNPNNGSYTDSVLATIHWGANSSSTNMPVSIRVGIICVVSATSLSFGVYSPSAISDSSATLTVNCTQNAPYFVFLDGGQSLSGSVRRMAAGDNYLHYGLFSDAARSVAWGDGTALGAPVIGTGTGGNQALTVYGRVPAGQWIPAGNYSDIVNVRVMY